MTDISTWIHRAPVLLGATTLVVIDGPSGSGKSVFAGVLAAMLDAATVISTDDFATWERPFSWWPRLADGVLKPLAHKETGHYRRTDWSSGTPGQGSVRTIEVPRFLILEGVSAARRAVTGLAGYAIWVECADAATRLERAVARDGAAQRAELARWQRHEQGWFAVDRPQDRADLHIAA